MTAPGRDVARNVSTGVNEKIMTDLFNNRYRTETTRFRGWDYGNPGHYFITITTKNRERFFGEIHDGDVLLSGMGEIARDLWMEIPEHFVHVELDEFIVMPDHVHGIINILPCNRNDVKSPRNDVAPRKSRNPRRDVACNVSTGITGTDMDFYKYMSSISPKPGSLPAIVRSYKSAVTKRCRETGNKHFAWQPRYYDRIIRDDTELENVRRYVRENPLKGRE